MIDRINLYFKIGAFHNIAFTDDEDTFVTRACQTETFQEVLDLAQELTDFVKNKTPQQPQQMPEIVNNEGETGNGSQQQEQLPGGESEEPSDMGEG